MVDLDSQGGLTRWWNRRNAGQDQTNMAALVNPALIEATADSVPNKAAAMRDRFDLIVIDSPPSIHETMRAVAGASDLAIVPCRPSVDDLDAVGPIVRLLRGTVDFGFVLTQIAGGDRNREAGEATAMLGKLAPMFGRVTSRLDYPRAAAGGRAAFETPGSATAWQEIIGIWDVLRDRLRVTSSSDHGIALSRDDGITAGD